MKHLTLLFSFLAAGFVMAQNQRFVYEYMFKPDSLDKNNSLKEIMNLDVNQDGSVFYSHLLLERDSVWAAQIENGRSKGTIILDASKVKKSQAKFVVAKKYPAFETVFYYPVNAMNLAVESKAKINWEIRPETDTIEGFKVQKAVTTFAGKIWHAWFTNEIQIQDGPYKFCGLPGLILSVEDDKGDHIFRLIGSKKQSKNLIFSPVKGKAIEVTPQKFNQLWNEFKKDPAKNIKLIHGSAAMSDTLFYDSKSGNPLTKQELIKRKEDGDKAYFRKFNNFIEPQLFK